ncbi:Putative glycosyltransferase EpsD [Phycisphaerales bacterium]|nr:Putative glycosyltransferase EpsD [Phycisphaerales bacterium]
MRILHISTRLILGGSQENTVLSCEGQARLGHEVHLAFGPIYGPEGSHLARVEAFNAHARARGGREIITHIVPDLVREISPFRDRRCRRQLRALIQRLRPDIVHTHSSKAGILGRAAAWDANRRLASGQGRCGVVHTIHGPPFMPVEGGAFKRLKVRMVNYGYTLAERYAAGRCHVIVSVADAMTREFLARGIGRPPQYLTVRSGMEVAPYLMATPGQTRVEVRARLGLSEADFVVGTVARLAEHKGHDDLLDAIGPDLKANPRWKMLWVGNGWWRERLLARARAMGLVVVERDAKRASGTPRAGEAPPQVILTGLVPPDQIPGLIRAMDVLAHPSYREGLPRTVPQALLCAVCPVAYDVDGTGEVCRDMETGRLVPLADSTRLGEAVRWCAANPGARKQLAERGREECRVAFSAEKMVQELEEVYRRALAGA